MPNQTPLNPDALEAAAKALYDHFKNQAANDGDSWPEWEERDEVGHGVARDDAEAAVSAYLAVAQPVVHPSEGERLVRELHSKEPARYYGTDLNPNNEFDCSCCGEGRPWPCATIRTLDAAQPVVNSVEGIPAQVQVISWEEEPEHECWKLAPDETFVGLIVKSDRAWSPADKYTLNIQRPVVNDA